MFPSRNHRRQLSLPTFARPGLVQRLPSQRPKRHRMHMGIALRNYYVRRQLARPTKLVIASGALAKRRSALAKSGLCARRAEKKYWYKKYYASLPRD